MRERIRAHPWLWVGVALVAIAVAILVFSRVSPSYDPYGWLVWGYQALHLRLSLGGAPSWKPVTFLFTFPYSLLGHLSVKLWMVTAAALSLAGPVVAGRIVYKLVYDSTGERGPAIAGAVAAGICLLETVQYTKYWITAQSDPMLVTLFLLWIDMQLRNRPRLAFTALWLCSLGRPEAWPFLGLYAIYAWRSIPGMRVFAAVGVALVPLLWFGVPVLSGSSPFVSGNLDLNSQNAIHGNKVFGTVARFSDLSYWPVKLAAAAGLAVAVYKRDRRVLAVAGAALLWVAAEVAFALHGWSAVPRYMFEASAAMVVVTGAGIGWILSETRKLTRAARLGGLATVVALAGWLVPGALAQVRYERAALRHESWRTTQIERLDGTIRALGGYRFVRSCGSPSTNVAYASILAWYTKLNVDEVGYLPAHVVTQRAPAVLFTQLDNGWEVQTYHLPASRRAGCARLNDVYFGPEHGHPGGVLIAHQHLPDSHFTGKRAV